MRKAYRSKVMSIDNEGPVGGTAAKHSKGSKDAGISVSMLTVEEVG